ncbi:MAG: copper oxidase [Thaumarchaeota archaeon]|nr:MAG: copper oxidase [Nitrososphaerota archaeon]
MQYQTKLYASVAISLILTGTILAAPASIAGTILGSSIFNVFGFAEAATIPAVTFQATDNPGSWFECSNTGKSSSIGCVPQSVAGTGEKSLAVIAPNEKIAFSSTGQAATLHTAVSLIYPTGAKNMPFDVDLLPPSLGGSGSPFVVSLNDPGIYVFFCDIHPYMFATVIVDDPKTKELDLGKTVSLPSVTAGGINALPTASDLALRLVHAFFVITNPNNWQNYPSTGTASWNPSYPPVPVLAYDANGNPVSVPDLNAFLHGYFGEPKTLSAPTPPSTPGVGQVWVDTQLEERAGKTKPGTATAVDGNSFKVVRKVALPSINMNNPHNMWTDRDQKVIYQTQWFDNRVTVFDRTSGELIKDVVVGPDPAHVMTRVNNDKVHVSLNGENSVVELEPRLAAIDRNIPLGSPTESTHPHAHWMSSTGQMMVTPNADTGDSTLYNFPTDSIASRTATGHLPIATGMMPDSSKYYVANFLDSSVSVIGIDNVSGTPSAHLIKNINLLANYNPISGAVTGPIGGLPIQTPVSPNGKYAIGANTLTATITVVDTNTDKLVASLPCDAGCHGVQFGAKQGGGYYAYVSSKFSNRMIVVDPDPNHDGNASDAAIAGSILLTTANASPQFKSDAAVTAYAGMGGQGVLPIPLVYNGWVQNLPESWKEKLSDDQLNPLGNNKNNSD